MFTNLVITILVVAAFVSPLLAQVPEFLMDCNKWPEICDNTCNALYCHSITNTLHYDPDSETNKPKPGSSRTAGDWRRANVGCGSSNYCAGTGKDCDEYPYASTYDGGVGCIAKPRFNGTVALSGTTRCANATQNRSHGATLAAFYARLGLTDGAAFRVIVNATSNITNSAICREVHPAGNNNLTRCPDESAGDYRFRSTPASDFCPSRASFISLDAEKASDSSDVESKQENQIPEEEEEEEEEEGIDEKVDSALESPGVDGNGGEVPRFVRGARPMRG